MIDALNELLSDHLFPLARMAGTARMPELQVGKAVAEARLLWSVHWLLNYPECRYTASLG